MVSNLHVRRETISEWECETTWWYLICKCADKAVIKMRVERNKMWNQNEYRHQHGSRCMHTWPSRSRLVTVVLCSLCPWPWVLSITGWAQSRGPAHKSTSDRLGLGTGAAGASLGLCLNLSWKIAASAKKKKYTTKIVTWLKTKVVVVWSDPLATAKWSGRTGSRKCHWSISFQSYCDHGHKHKLRT